MSAVTAITQQRELRGELYSFLFCVFQVGALYCYKGAVAEGSRNSVMFIGLVAGVVSILLLKILSIEMRHQLNKPSLGVGVFLGLTTAIATFAMGKALGGLNAGMVSVLMSTAIFHALVLEKLFFKSPLTIQKCIAAVGAVVGVALIRLYGKDVSATSSALGWGLVLGLIASINGIIVRATRKKTNLSSVNLFRMSFAIPFLALVPGTLGGIPSLPRDAIQMAAIAGVLGPTVSHIFRYRSLRYITASYAMILGLLIPIIALTIDVALLGYGLSLGIVLGVGLILFSVAIASMNMRS